MLLEQKVGELLQKHELKLSTAESCTGGLIANRLTNIPGSSVYFPGGLVAYSYEMKTLLLGVSWDALNTVGAVSEEVVIQMAQGARRMFETELAVSVSGIAGPGGGTPEKPVGATWIGLASPDGVWARHFIWDGDREQNKHSSSEAALQFVVDYLEGNLK
jgi:nicotinamide-nucleotide amidase